MNEIEKSKSELAVLRAIIDDLNKTIIDKSSEVYAFSKEIFKARQKIFKVIVGRCYKNNEDIIFMVSGVPDYGTYSNWINFNQIPCLMLNKVENTISFEKVFLKGGNDIEDERTLLAAMEKQYTPISNEEFVNYCNGYIGDLINGIVNNKEDK